jgi:hypothetical protein
VTYNRRWYERFLAVDNLAVTPSDYDPYCITSPVDARLPGGGGQQICGLFDLNPLKVGQINNLGTFASNYGKQTERWQGVDLTVDARLPNHLLLQGGVSIGNTITDNCDIAAALPESVGSTPRAYCHVETPYQPQVKFVAAYTLPWDIQFAGAFQSVPGAAVSANVVVPNAAIVPSLKRDLSAGKTATVTVNVVPPATQYGDRLNQLDVRFAKTFRMQFLQSRLKGMIDLYNVTNANPVLTWNNTYGTTGASWLVPQSILPGRLVKFGAQWDF